MDQIASALGDAARWRMVELLAERPRSVGELAQLTGLRQPQTTKHLQTLARAGLVTVFPLGQRRVYALDTPPLRGLAQRLLDLADTAAAHSDDRAALAHYRTAIDTETRAAQRDRWADGRDFDFERTLAAPRDLVWRYWTDAELLGSWWVPPALTVAECVLEPRPGGRTVLDYRDAEGRHYRSAGRVAAANAPEHLVFELSVLDDTGAISFTGHYDLTLTEVADGTRLRLHLTLTDTAAAAAPYVAGIETGWNQVLGTLADTIATRLAKEVQP
ncbi:metalloregulator ArsR/SmtB family transcription factor [Nocardia otitidiscaviarum]|uniref:metalloregulator ArsR/SmtB family transcription factor n=1 Tax=Nocardia otitidiscaviarum TaxID=1823 RepID=UPI001893FFE0|nr:metalloregulator ArsR/SmtB family transcription factor [Nocardia otitidiscaviarum]MBF6238590.1 metalloregulator ArsR/SmtB family transcription factor [Nocardia otitidiscaviarum]